MKATKKILALLLALLLLLPVTALADGVGSSFTCYGNDLSNEQFQTVVQLLGTDMANDTLISVTHEDEKNLLGNVVSAEKIGSRSLSSARVTLTQEGSGISVTTHNINWVTPSMYSSALTTAGVENASIVVAAPVTVSGTAALAGILKAYENAAGVTLSDIAKEVAGSEMVLTGNLAELIGSEDAVELLAMVKQAIADYDLDNYDNLRPYVVEGARQLGISLTDAQIDEITKLGVRIAKLDLDPDKLAGSLNGLIENIQKIEKVKKSTQTVFSGIKDAVQGFFSWIGGWFKK